MNTMHRIAACVLGLAFIPSLPAAEDSVAEPLAEYNIRWDTPSKHAGESMPCGGRDTGLNVWVENGSIVFYMQRSGSYDKNGQYMKLGRVRVTLSPNPLLDGERFLQELDLAKGHIEISGTKSIPGHGKVTSTSRIWVDTADSTIHFTCKSNRETELKVEYENWRHEEQTFSDPNGYGASFAVFEIGGKPGTYHTAKDQFEAEDQRLLFYHRNPEQTIVDLYIEQQGVGDYRDQIYNDLCRRTFGGVLYGEGLQRVGGKKEQEGQVTFTYESTGSGKNSHFAIGTHIAQTATLDGWKEQLLSKAKTAPEISKARSERWWDEFWSRSWIRINPGKSESDVPWRIARNYQLFRYQLGCNFHGEFPTKFNGGHFTVDPRLTVEEQHRSSSQRGIELHSPDWRSWGGHCFTAQNQRLVHWPMLKTGDAGAMLPQLDLFRKGLPGATARVEKNFGHPGAVYCEYSNTTGLAIPSAWGWRAGEDFMPGTPWGWQGDKSARYKRSRGEEIPFGAAEANGARSYGSPVEKGVMANGSIAYHWESQVEHAYMALLYHKYTAKDISAYMPFIKAALIFFDEHYQKRKEIRDGKPLDEKGKIVIYPSTACESYRGATNPSDLVSGIRSCLRELLAQELGLSAEEKKYFEGYLARVPEIAFGKAENGVPTVKPAEKWIRYQNCECPQFYPLFPFNVYNLKDDDLAPFQNAWKHGDFPKGMYWSWHQDGIFFARMGMTREAADFNTKKLNDSGRRFPTFWGPGHDWVPDHNWGGSGMLGLQEMLMQTFDKKILLFPAWPKDWDVSFKLHAPYQTTVQGRLVDGEIVDLVVSPESRRKDVVLMLE